MAEPPVRVVLELVQLVLYVGLAVAALTQWRRRPTEATAWLAATFGVLAAVILAGRVIPEDPSSSVALWSQRVLVGVLVLFPYFLYRFMASFIPPLIWVKRAATIATAALVVGALFLPELPEAGDPRPAWFQGYLTALLVQWVTLSMIVAVRLWRSGRDQPAVARVRMRTMSLGAAALAIALVLAVEVPSAGTGVQVLVQLFALLSAPLLLLGFAPPRFIRTIWRSREESDFRRAELKLMSATSAEEVAETVVPHARRLVGGTGAVLQEPEGKIILTDGRLDEMAAGTDPELAKVVSFALRSGRLTVAPGPFAPFFGGDEMAVLESLATLTDLALARIDFASHERRLAAIVESSDDAIYGKTIEGTITSWNPGAERLYGFSASEIIGQSVTMLFPPDLREEETAILERVGNGEKIEHHETRRVCKDGSVIDVSLTISPIRDSTGRVAGASVIARDITQIKRANEALRTSEERNRLILETSNDAYIAIDDAGLIREWNTRAGATFGWSSNEVIGKPLHEIVIPERYRHDHVMGLAQFFKTGQGPVLGNTVELEGLHRGGYEFPIELTVWPLEVEGSYTFHAFLRDITERRQVQEDLSTAQEEADRANQAKSEFLSRMSHELRTPLNAILGFAQLLELEELTDEQRDSTEQILKGGELLLELINEVLDISRIESGQLRLSPEPVSVSEVVDNSIRLIAPLAVERGIRVQSTLEPEPPNGHVVADRQRLGQVLLNLLANAVKYNVDGGSVTVAYSLSPDEGRAQITVSDTGPGVPAEKVPLLFTPFERLGAEESSVEGTGLGLALCKSLVDAMDGRISVETTLGSGTTIRVELPTALPHAAEVPPAADERAADEPAARPFSVLEKVLYVEDNLANLKLVDRILGRLTDAELIPAMTGELGLELARQHLPDLILLDLHLPDMRGDVALSRLRKDPKTSSLPVVILSADATPGEIKRLLAAGADDYLTKPLKLADFAEALKRLVGDPDEKE